ncbi:hypothetical protein [Desulfotomaculum sp. 1211_IL3151]|uniref:hypothetical protein n=1 Tax=Desulfotomaculum sp. 1211_IL3151 TaxID=3084055 RepID=UPI002FDA4416
MKLRELFTMMIRERLEETHQKLKESRVYQDNLSEVIEIQKKIKHKLGHDRYLVDDLEYLRTLCFIEEHEAAYLLGLEEGLELQGKKIQEDCCL